MSNLYFYIHYCKYKQINEADSHLAKFARTLQHHALIFITQGKGSVTTDHQKYSLKEGMLFYIQPGVPHSVELDINEPISLYSVHFSCARVSINNNNWAISEEIRRLPLRPTQELKNYYHFEDMFKKLVDSWHEKLPGYEFTARTFLQQIFIDLYQNISKQDKNYSIQLKVEKVIEYMHQNINQKVTLPELSAMVQLSPFYLSRAFKETTGYSVIEYFNKIKIDKAKELIVDGDKKVKEVAQALGFTDEFYFSRIFKKIAGISPSKFYSKNVHEV